MENEIIKRLHKQADEEWNDIHTPKPNFHDGIILTEEFFLSELKALKEECNIESFLDKLKTELESGADCYMDCEGANADDLNDLVFVINFIEKRLKAFAKRGV